MKTKICSRCILDSNVPGITFDDRGVCNYCKIHDEIEKQHPLNETGQQKLNEIIEEIKSRGKDKKYDCILGVSGGTDSTYILYMAKKLGLRPLAVHVDNGWNSEIAVTNIKNAITKLDIDLHTVVLDWEEFKDLQIAFLKASVPDVEIATDHAIEAVLYRVAAEEDVHYIVQGHSFRSEGKIPVLWGYGDWRYIKSVYKTFSKTKRLKNFPKLSLFDFMYYFTIKRIKEIRLLYFMDYRKEEAKKILKDELGWRDYGGKHYESIYTRFIQSYLLPKKFNIDKRKVHFSALIRSGQMTRDEAFEKIKEPPISEVQAREDREYVIKKLGLTEEEFKEILSAELKTFLDYPTYYPVIKRLRVPIRLAYRFVSPSTPAFLLLKD